MTWEPLHGGDPFPANRFQVRSYGDRVKRTGELIGEQVTLLRRLADGDSWRTDTADAFRDKGEELADLIEKTQDRYIDVGSELVAFADTLDGYEDEARALVREAQAELDTIRANPEVTASPEEDGSPGELTPSERAQNSRRASAELRLSELQRLFDGIVASAESAASTAAGRIRGYIDDDVKDSWWDRNAGWLGNLRTALGIIAAVAGIVLLTVATGGTIWLVALGAALVAGAGALAISIGNLVSGNGGWADVAIDTVGLLTLGAGGVALRLMSRGFPAVRTAMAALRGRQAFAATMGRFGGVPIAVYSRLASLRVNLFGVRGWAVGRISAMADDALAAANAAYDATMAPPVVNLGQRLLYGGRETAGVVVQSRQFLDELARLGDAPVELVDDVAGMVRLGRTLTLSSLVGSANDVVDIAREANEFARDVKVLKVLVDVVSRFP